MWLVLAILFSSTAAADPAWNQVDVLGCENVFRLSDHIYSGGEPHDAAAFKNLADLGIKTIVSVDGAKPDVETASKYGLRYIHLPIGYDGISRERGLQFGRIVSSIEGPVYFHCHHGKHRGPAAVAAGMEAAGKWQPTVARAFLKTAGTADKYTGLYAFIDAFTPPTAEELAQVDATFPAATDTPPFQASMALIDRQKDNLALAEKSGWRSPEDHPDIAPAHEALQLRESLTELVRLDPAPERPQAYQDLMKEALAAAENLEAALRTNDNKAATAAFQTLNQACNACHEQFRD